MRALPVLLVLLLVPAVAAAEPDVRVEGPKPLFIGIGAAAMVPFGNWAQNAGAGTGGYPGDLPQFSPGGAGQLTFGFAPQRSRWISLGMELGYEGLGTQDWQGYVKKRGAGAFSAAARLYSVAAAGTVDIPGRTGRYSVELHGSLGMIFPSGGEDLAGQTYNYAFLRDTLFGRVGARFVARFGSGLEGYAGVDILAAPGGVQHRDTSPVLPGASVASRESFTISAIEPALGLRMWFDPL